VHGGEEPLRHSRTAVEIGRDERARLLSDVEPNGRGLGDDDPWLRKLHADRPTISARWTACPTRARVPIIRFWPLVPVGEFPLFRAPKQRPVARSRQRTFNRKERPIADISSYVTVTPIGARAGYVSTCSTLTLRQESYDRL
jgi:hypothetical protein